MFVEKISARGHRNVLSLHKTTLEVTKEDHLTPRGDCIIAVSADKGCLDLSEGFKEALRRPDARLRITVSCGCLSDVVSAQGHPGLVLTHPTDLVVRKSDFICPRTLAVKADKAACDLDRALVEKLRKDSAVSVVLEIY